MTTKMDTRRSTRGSYSRPLTQCSRTCTAACYAIDNLGS
jgi:hypothetical protein